MSFVRKRTPSVTSTGNRQVGGNSALKKKSLTKPVWDATNSDLSQLKPTNEELERRKQSFQSKNAEAVKHEKQRQAIMKAKKEQSKSTDTRSQLAMLKEILYDDEQLKKLMTKSDSTLKTVHDFFNEDEQAMQNNQFLGNKKQVKINMTLAPNVTDLNESNLPHNVRNKNPKKQVNHIQKALVNNTNDFSEDEGNSDAESDILDLKLKLAKKNEDMETYRQLLELKQDMINKKLNSPSLKKNPLKKPLELNDLDECIRMLSSKETNTPARQSNSNNSNDTEKINRLKNLIKNYASSINLDTEEPKSNQHDSSSTPQLSARPSALSNLNDEFKRALTDLENKLYDFEKETGHKKASDCSIFKSLVDGSSSMSNSSYTLSLIKIVSTMLDYQKETLSELNHEKLKNQESNKQLDIHRKLIDGLTNEILCVKEQNEKISHCYINQATQQAKVEAELEQIKIMLRTSSVFNQQTIQMQPHPPIIDSQPKTMSAFYPAQHPDINSIVKPLPQTFSEQSNTQQEQLRPMSCVMSVNEYNRQNSVKNPFDEALNEVKTDKFVERLNAMLYQNNHLDGQITSASCHNLAANSSQSNKNINNFQQQSVIRSSSALGHGNQFRPNDFNNSSEIMISEQSGISQATSKYSDYNTRLQIQELGAKNIQAQQILKQMQAEQLFTNPSSHNLKTENVQKPKIQENLNKLKEEQQLLKDQINKLNKQRESAQVELEVLSHNGSVTGNHSKNDRQSRSTFMKQLQEIEFERIEINRNETPNMSPIPNENIFQEGIESKSSGHRFNLPSNGNTANSQNFINKNRD